MDKQAAQKAHDDHLRREREEKFRQAQILRIEHALKLNELGMEENITMQYAPAGIGATVTLNWVTPEQQAQNKQQMEKFLADLKAMGAPQAPALVGPDGKPMQKQDAK